MRDMEDVNKIVDDTLLFKNINALCDEKNTSVSQMLRDLGLPKSTVSNWRDTRSWMESLPLIAKYLDVSIDSLFCNTDRYKEKYKELEEAVVRYNLTADDIKVLCGMAKLISRYYR